MELKEWLFLGAVSAAIGLVICKITLSSGPSEREIQRSLDFCNTFLDLNDDLNVEVNLPKFILIDYKHQSVKRLEHVFIWKTEGGDEKVKCRVAANRNFLEYLEIDGQDVTAKRREERKN